MSLGIPYAVGTATGSAGITTTNPTSAGDAIFVVASTSSAVSGVTDSAGNTYLQMPSDGTNHGYLFVSYYKGVPGTPTAALSAGGTISLSSGTGNIVAGACSGVTAQNAVDKSPAFASGSGTSVTSTATGTLSQSIELLISGIADSANGSITWTGSFTGLGSALSVGNGAGLGYRIVSANTTIQATATLGTTANWDAFIISLIPAPAPYIVPLPPPPIKRPRQRSISRSVQNFTAPTNVSISLTDQGSGTDFLIHVYLSDSGVGTDVLPVSGPVLRPQQIFPIPGPQGITAGAPDPASALEGMIRQNSLLPYTVNPSQQGKAVFSYTNYPFSPSLITDVVWMPANVLLDANISITGSVAVGGGPFAAQAGFALGAITTVSSNYTVQATDVVVLANASISSITITLPNATITGFAVGQWYTIKKIDSSANTVTVAGSSGQLIDGASTQILNSAQIEITVLFDGTNWRVINGGTAAGTSVINGVTVSGTAANGKNLMATGTATATWQFHPVDWLNVVTEYGADPTGVADSTTAIQNALNAVPANGGTVYLPAGIYTVSSSLTPTVTGTRIVGGGWGSQIRYDGTVVTTGAIKMADTTNRRVNIENIRISQSNATSSGTAIDASYFQDSLIWKVLIDGGGGSGVPPVIGISFNAAAAFYNVVSDCRINCAGANSIGIRFDTGANSNVVRNCRILPDAVNTTGIGVYVNSRSIVLDHVDIESAAGTGISVGTTGHACTMISPYLEANATNLLLASGVNAPIVIGGTVEAGTTADFTDNGALTPQFLNVRSSSGGEHAYSKALTTNQASPEDQSLGAWTYDPAIATNGSQPGAGVIQLVRVSLRRTTTISNVILDVTAAGSLTSGQNFAGLYNSSGSLLNTTADQTTPWGSTGLKTMALGTAQTVLPGNYYVGFVTNGGSVSTFARSTGVAGTSGMVNAGLSVSTARFATAGTVTSLPASITMANNTFAAVPFWAAVS